MDRLSLALLLMTVVALNAPANAQQWAIPDPGFKHSPSTRPVIPLSVVRRERRNCSCGMVQVPSARAASLMAARMRT